MTDPTDAVTQALPTPGAGPEMRLVEVALITASSTNPRKTFDQAKLAELADSIKSSGVHQPVLLRPLPASRLADTFDFRRAGEPLPAYELVCGERRLRASRIAQLREIPAMIRELSDDQVLEIQIVENLQRDDLSALEEAEGYESLMKHSQLNADEVGAKIGKSRSYVYGRLKLLDLGTEGRDALRAGVIDASKALLLARIPDHKLQAEACEEITDDDNWQGAVMSYRAAARLVQDKYMLRLDKAKFSITDATLLPHAGGCDVCPNRTGAQPELFSDVKSADVCINPTCYRQKEAALAARQVEQARANGQTVIDADEAKNLLHENGSHYNAKFKGYRRLDTVEDSPTDKPLRKLLEKVMQAEGVAPIMIENPHKPGELVACLTNDTVSRLLKLAEGQVQAAKAVPKEVKELVDAKKAKADAKAQAKYEVEWRRQLITRCWDGMLKCTHAIHTLDMHRFLALRTLPSLSTEQAAAVCDVLEIGKVSPISALRDYLQDAIHPDYVHLIMIAQRESDPSERDAPYLRKANEGMHKVAGAVFRDQVQDVIKEVQASAAALFLPKIEAAVAEAPASASTPTPAAHADDSARKTSSRKRPAARASAVGSEKTSQAEAAAQIAAALQAVQGPDQGAASAALGDEAGPVADALGQPGGSNEAAVDLEKGAAMVVGVGATVRVNESVPMQAAKFIGKIGIVDRVMGDGSCWSVTFSPTANKKFSGWGSFHVSELDVITAAPEAAPVDQAEEVQTPAPEAQEQPAVDLQPGQVVKIKTTAANRKWRGKEAVLLSRKTKDPEDTDPMWMVRQGVPPKHSDCSFFASDLELVGEVAA